MKNWCVPDRRYTRGAGLKELQLRERLFGLAEQETPHLGVGFLV